MKRQLRIIHLLLLIGAICLVGCEGREVGHQLEQKDALRATEILGRYGIDVDHEVSKRGKSERYNLWVPSAQFSRAFSILAEYNMLSADEKTSADEIGFIPPTPEDLRRRANLVQAKDCERLLLGIQGVAAVKVLIGEIPNAGTVSRKVTITVKTEPGVREQSLEEQIRQVASNLFAEIPRENVSLILSPISLGRPTANGADLVELFFPFSFRVPVSDIKRVQLQIYSMFGLAIVLSLVVGASIGAFWQARREKWIRRSHNSVTAGTRVGAEHVVGKETKVRSRTQTGNLVGAINERKAKSPDA